MGESFGICFGGLHALGQVSDLLFAGGLILSDFFELAVLVVDEERRCGGVGNSQNDEDPFADVALRLRVINGRLIAFRHSVVSG